jgi:hypothetical protein
MERPQDHFRPQSGYVQPTSEKVALIGQHPIDVVHAWSLGVVGAALLQGLGWDQ